nr:endo-1,4-beta xylanase B [uncultured bacterium]
MIRSYYIPNQGNTMPSRPSVSLTLLLTLLAASVAVAADLPPEQSLWPEGFENPIAYTQDEAVRVNNVRPTSPSGSNRVFNFVSKPTYTIHPAAPGTSTGVGLVICPGGGYRDVWLDREGHDLAMVLQKQGITSLVLKYRTNTGSRTEPAFDWDKYLPAVEADARQAISILRKNANELKINPSKIGISGFSAGGNLAILAAIFQPTDGNASGVPDFAGLFYPWLRDDYTQTIEQNGKNIPPLFIMNAVDDRVTPADKCLQFYTSLLNAKVKTELHLYNQGGHGFDLGLHKGESTSMWPASFVAWLKDEGFVEN